MIRGFRANKVVTVMDGMTRKARAGAAFPKSIGISVSRDMSRILSFAIQKPGSKNQASSFYFGIELLARTIGVLLNWNLAHIGMSKVESVLTSLEW